MTGEIMQRDRKYWTEYLKPMLGDWLNSDTPVEKVASFIETVYLKRDLRGFEGDPRFIANDYSRKMYSKLRCAIAGVYAWRAKHAAGETEKARMTHEADFAFRQAWALCPDSLEVVNGYVDILASEKRTDQAIWIAETASKFPSTAAADMQQLADKLKITK
jgi:hypothetical protein